MKRSFALVLTLASGIALTAAAQTPSAPSAPAATLRARRSGQDRCRCFPGGCCTNE